MRHLLARMRSEISGELDENELYVAIILQWVRIITWMYNTIIGYCMKL